MVTKIDIINSIIAGIALVVAISSFFYTAFMNRRRLSVERCYGIKSDLPPHVMFSVVNLSSQPITISAINLFSESGDKLKPLLDYTPPQSIFYAYLPENDPLTSPHTLHPHGESTFSYYLRTAPDKINVAVTCTKAIAPFRKTKSFMVDVDYEYERYNVDK